MLCQLFSAISIPRQCFTIPCTDDLIIPKYPLPFSPNTRDSEVRFTYWPYALLELKDVFFLCYSFRRESHKSYQMMWLFLHINCFLPSLCVMPFSHSPPFLPWPLRALVHTLPWTPFLLASSAFTLTPGQWRTSAGLPSQIKFFPPPPTPPSSTMELSLFSIHPTSPSTTNICEPPCAQPFFP